MFETDNRSGASAESSSRKCLGLYVVSTPLDGALDDSAKHRQTCWFYITIDLVFKKEETNKESY